jgi:enediyne biosynthesis protein CalE5
VKPADPAVRTVVDQQRDNWNDLSGAWDKWYDVFEAGAAPVTSALLERGGVRPGAAVVDIGSGTGEPAISAARLAGEPGHVRGVDVAPDMIAIARRRGAGLPRLSFEVGDAAALEAPAASFDTVLARWSLMFLPDRHQALQRLLGLLRPGGRLAGSSWSVPPRAPVIATAFGVIAARLELPPPPAGTPGPFTMADPPTVAAELTAAGFQDAGAEELPLTFRFDSVDSFVEFSRDLLPAGMRALVGNRLDPAGTAALWAEVGDRVRPFTEATGELAVSSVAVVFHATKGQ